MAQMLHPMSVGDGMKFHYSSSYAMATSMHRDVVKRIEEQEGWECVWRWWEELLDKNCANNNWAAAAAGSVCLSNTVIVWVWDSYRGPVISPTMVFEVGIAIGADIDVVVSGPGAELLKKRAKSSGEFLPWTHPRVKFGL